MFYCEECRKKNKWPLSFNVSHGRCEICGKHSICCDVKSEHLGILAGSRYGYDVKPDKVKPLAQYLAEYLEHEHDHGKEYTACFINSYPDGSVNFDMYCLRIVLKQALDAYQSTENVKIRIEPT